MIYIGLKIPATHTSYGEFRVGAHGVTKEEAFRRFKASFAEEVKRRGIVEYNVHGMKHSVDGLMKYFPSSVADFVITNSPNTMLDFMGVGYAILTE